MILKDFVLGLIALIFGLCSFSGWYYYFNIGKGKRSSRDFAGIILVSSGMCIFLGIVFIIQSFTGP